MKKVLGMVIFLLTAVFALAGLAETSGDWEYTLIEDQSAVITAYLGEDTEIEIPESFQSDGDTFTVTGIVSDVFSEALETMTGISFNGDTLPEVIPSGDSAMLILADQTAIRLKNGSECYAYDLSENVLTLTTWAGNGNDASVASSCFGLPVTKIGANAFSGNFSLIAIPSSVESLDGSAFQNASPVSITIQANIQELPAGIFEGKTSLVSVSLPNTLTSIGENAFYGTGLTSVTLPGNISAIGSGAFAYCYSLETVEFPASLLSLGESVLHSDASLTAVNFNGAAAAIGAEAFYGCSLLNNVANEGNLISIGSNAFEDCSALSTFYFGSSITTIGNYAFADTGLQILVLPDDLISIGEGAFSGSAVTGVLAAGDERAENVIFGEGADRSFKEEAGEYLNGDASFPSGLRSIGRNAFSSVSGFSRAVMPSEEVSLGYQAFDSDVPVYTAEPECEWIYTIHGSNCTIIGYLGSTPDLIVPTDLNGLHVTAFGDEVFRNMAFLKTIQLPADTASIGLRLFYNCRNLTEASLGSKLVILPTQSFFACTSLNTVHYPEDKLRTIGDYAFFNCVALTDAGIPEGVTRIGDGAFEGCGNMTQAELPQSLTYLGAGVFADCKSLTSISIPDGVTSLDANLQEDGRGSFSGCAALASVTIGRGLTSLASNTFAGLVNLQTVTVNADSIQIASYAFNGCVALQEVTIQNAVVGYRAFSNCTGLKSFTLQSGHLESEVFSNCTALETVVLGNNVSSIPYSAFSGLTRLKSVTLQGNLTEIPGYAFNGCSALKDISLPATVGSIGSYAFAGSSITGIRLPGSLTAIDDGAFYSCSGLQTINWNYGLQEIGSNAFYGCAFSQLTLPGSVSTIGQNAFQNCPELTRVNLPSYITGIGTGAFPTSARIYCDASSTTARTLSRAGGSFAVEGEGMDFGIRLLMRGDISLGLSLEKIWTNQETIVIPSSIGGELVTEMGSGLFAACPSVRNVTFPTSVPAIPANLCAGNVSLTDVTIPEGVTIVGARAFQNCVNLHDVTLPSTVVSIGESAFEGCSLLTEISLSDNIQEIGANAFTETKVYCTLNSKTAEMLSQNGGGFICREYPLLRLRYLFVDGLPQNLEVVGADSQAVMITVPESVTSIADEAFLNNTTLTTVNLPDTLTHMGEYAFAGSGITSILLPENLTEIPAHAFENTASLQNVTVSGVVTEVGEYAFAGSGVRSLTFRDGLLKVRRCAFQGSALESCVLPDSVTDLGYNTFENCARLVHFDIPAGVSLIGLYTFRNTPSLKTVLVPSGVTTIGSSAFENSGLASISLPDTVKTIGSQAFYNCRSLKKVEMAGDMLSIGSSAFQDCILLNDLTMSGTLKTMESHAFYGCIALKDATLPRNLVFVPENAFAYCTALTHVKISDGTVNIGNNAFYDCSRLVSVELPVGLKGIGHCAFQNCSLASVTIPESVTSIGEYAFCNNALASLILPDSVASLGNYAFENNHTLTSLRLPGTLVTVPQEAFYNSGLTILTIPDGVRALAYYSFAQSSNLTAVLIPASVESIDDTAFDYCGYPLTIYCYHDTEAESFAERKGYPIIYLDGEKPLEGITLSGKVNEINMGVGDVIEGVRQYFSILPEDIPYEYILRFSTDPEDVALAAEYLDENDMNDASLTGMRAGTATLTAYLEENPDISASILVHVRERISAIYLPPEIWQKKDVPLDLSQLLTTDPAGVTDGFTWTINRDVGYLENSILYPTAFGNATLTVTGWNGVSASVPLHVYEDPTEIRLKNVPVGLDTGMQAALAPEVRAGYLFTGILAQHFIEWSSSDESIATVDASGMVTAVDYGTATIYATAYNEVVGMTDIYVSPPIDSFCLEGRVMLPVGGSMVLTATEIEPANANPGAFTWTTEPAGLVSYENGIVTVLTDQTCHVTITATPWSGAAPQSTDLTIYRPTVESVTIDPVNEWNWVPTNSEIQLTAHVLATDEFINQLVTWTVENNGYSDYVDRNGVLHTRSSGWRRSLNITATADNGQSDTITVYVVYPTEDFQLPDRITVQTGETVSVEPVNNNSYTEYKMSVGTKSLARVDGMSVTGLKPGETALTVTSWDGVSRQTTLLVYDPIERIDIRDLESYRNKFAVADPQHNLFAQWEYVAHADAISDKTYRDDLITWSSSNPSVIQVTDEVTGAFRTVSYGTAILTATAKSGISASTELNVRREIRTFTLSPITGYVRSDVQLAAETIDPENGYDGFVWTMNPASIGTVEGQMLHVTADQPVTGTLTATSWDGYVTKQTDITILREPVTAVQIDEYGNGEIGVGGTYQLTAHVSAGYEYINQLVTWSSSDDTIATVDDQGRVTCVGSGAVTITATADDGTGVSDSVTLTGVQGVTGFTVSPEEITVYAGESAEISITDIQPENAIVREFTYTVSPEEAAVVEDGKLIPLATWTTDATLTVTSWNGTQKTVPVHILRPEISELIIDGEEEAYVGTPVQMTVHVIMDDGQTFENRFVRWESSDPEIAEVDQQGLVTPKAVGGVNIYAYDRMNSMISDNVYLYCQVALEDYHIVVNGDEYCSPESSIYVYASGFIPDDANQRVYFTAEADDGEITSIDQYSSNYAYIYYTGPETTVYIKAVSANGLERTAEVDLRYYISELYTDTENVDEQTIPAAQFLAVGESRKLPLYLSSSHDSEDSRLPKLKLSYTSDNEEVASVDESGLVTGRKKGSANITVTHDYPGTSVTIPVKVLQPVDSFDLPGRVKVPVGSSIDLPVNNMLPTDTDAEDLIWTVEPEGIARVENGKLTALTYKDTNGTLTATSINGITHNANLTIYSPWIDQIELEEVGNVMVGDTVQLVAHVTSGEDEFINAGVKFKAYVWDYGNGNYGGEFNNGYGSGYLDENTGILNVDWISYNHYYIIAISELSGAMDVVEINIMPGYADFQVTSPMVLHPGESEQRIHVVEYQSLMEYDYNPEEDSAYLYYESDETELFSLSGYYVYPNSEGKTGVGTIRVRSVNGVERKVKVVVCDENDVENVSVTGVPAYAAVYQNIPLTAHLSLYGTSVPVTNQMVTWSSDAPKVASVNANGVVRTLGYGTARITATAPNGKADTVTVTVSREPDNFTLPESFTVEYGQTIELFFDSAEPEDAVMDIVWTVEPADLAIIEGNRLTSTVQENKSAVLTATNWDGTVRTTRLYLTYTPPMTTLRLPEMLTEIEEEAFEGIGVQQVYIPSGCVKIGARAFADNTELMVVHIPDSVTEIVDTAFAGCLQLTIYCGTGSRAEDFAIRNNIPYINE